MSASAVNTHANGGGQRSFFYYRLKLPSFFNLSYPDNA